ncbi:hypothetical protein Pmar_PMAR001194 [Perkinsus marinus ATCC 50983]|uniref:Uncharacterized protein n=1 Tax=Perkinsus marinus (strain ATCC 50983 / TXsc) TaxID=423536 RepID=C5KT46_PERM5|nr:hypothetical protein Pmar_PMAR001194 [Perkinsus marinus ATCC 50983]EER12396.1 hypothetical protein Pmar_PMAR001194 [Perkinsus marinus ATCC 50983]|eukprot:XP_002780601.1 hypothetical protein Pmar_PMAR001194 [Perkinsus marinus ATCC 50983]
MDWMFYYFPNYSRDKVALMSRQIKIHFVIGFALVFLVYHPPYKGADYENFHKSPLYQALLESLDTIRTEPDDVAKKFGIDIPSTPALRSGPAAMALVQHGSKKINLLDKFSAEDRAQEAEIKKSTETLADVEKHLDNNLAIIDKDLH